MDLSQQAAQRETDLALGLGGNHSKYTSGITADTSVKASRGILYGIIVNVAVAAAAINVLDNTAAGGGNTIITIPIGAAAGSIIHFGGVGIEFNTGLFIDYLATATGTITVLWV